MILCTIIDLKVRTNENGKSEFCCKPCSKARNGIEKWYSSRSYARSHFRSGEHQKALQRIKEIDLQKRTLAYEAAQEAASISSLNAINPPKAPPSHSPRMTCFDKEKLSTLEYLDEFTFSAGPDSIDHLSSIPTSYDSHFWPDDSGIMNDPQWDPLIPEETVASVLNEMSGGQYRQAFRVHITCVYLTCMLI